MNKKDKEENRLSGKLRIVIEHINRKQKVFYCFTATGGNGSG